MEELVKKMRIAFFHHPYHSVTGSSKFMIELLSQNGHEVEVFNRDELDKIMNSKFDSIYLWQAEKLINQVPKCYENIVCAPMIDDALDSPASFFKNASRAKFISFSKTMHQFLTLAGVRSNYIKYWPEIPNYYKKDKRESIFFWERSPSHLPVHEILRLTSKLDMPIHVRKKPDPHDNAESVNFDNTKRVIDISAPWFSREEYLNLVSENLIYVQPRLWEGIGMSFLEAMSLGMVVVSPNRPTMNEYIKDGKNGILFNSRPIAKHSINQLREIGERARITAQDGRQNFIQNSKLILEVLNEEFSESAPSQRGRNYLGDLTLRKFIFIKSRFRS